MSAAEILRISDESDRAELAEALVHLRRRAGREFPVVGPTDHPTPWDLRHRAINELLDQYASARG